MTTFHYLHQRAMMKLELLSVTIGSLLFAGSALAETQDPKRRSNMKLACNLPIASSVVRVAATILLIAGSVWLMSVHPVEAANNAINLAADQINSVLPPAMPQQTIVIGTYNGANQSFGWLLPESYPPGTPEHKKAENGGPVPPQHATNINSFNVQYRFNVLNRPPGFQLKMTVTDATGRVVEQPATLDSSGASVSFNAMSGAVQTVKISPGNLTLRIHPHLREQLGAFVVPHLLVAILYDPPGEGSSSSFSNTSTAGTVLSWDFSRTSGMVETVDPNRWMELFNLAVQGITTAAGVPAAGQVMTTFSRLFAEPTVDTTTMMTRSESSSKGTFFSVTHAFATDNQNLYPYPGKGDAYIILHDVLFVYVAKNGKVYLAPVACAKGFDKLMPWQLKDYLPPPLVERYLALDPMVTNQPPNRRTLTPTGMRMPQRFRYADSLRCQLVQETYGYTWEEIQTTGMSQTTTHTVVEKGGGFITQLTGGGGGAMWGITYTTSVQQIVATEDVASLTVRCAEAPGYWIDVYYDAIFRTLLGVRGDPLTPAGQAALTGTATDALGRPVPNLRVSLAIGDARYSVHTDNMGNFLFPVATLPRGTGTLIVGASKSPITYTGSPLRNVRLLVPGGQALPRLPGDIRLRSVEPEEQQSSPSGLVEESKPR
jgi:hypothetical protein